MRYISCLFIFVNGLSIKSLKQILKDDNLILLLIIYNLKRNIQSNMFSLPPLPYNKDDFPNQISQESFDYHYGKHHQTYINNLNALIKDTKWEHVSLETIIEECDNKKILNNAAQHYNHSLYWHCITPFENQPSGQFKQQIEKSWGSQQGLEKQLLANATANFGSGWTWLVKNKKQKRLQIMNTSNAQNPLVNHNLLPLLTIDVWEHAYYIDYRNARPSYVKTFINMLDWKFAGKIFDSEKIYTV